MSNKIVVYFSRTGQNYVGGAIKNLTTGNTEVAARMIGELTGADLFYVEPVELYSEDYNICIEEAKKDLKAKARPEFKNPLKDIDEYDTIYLGYPNYWGTMPVHVFSFLERYDFSGKTIKPFCTHEGSGLGGSEADIRKACPGAIVEKGLAIKGSNVTDAKGTIEKWL